MDVLQIIIFAFILDFLLGDPQNPIHPIRIIGNVIYFGIHIYEKINKKNPIFSFVYGLILSIICVFFSYEIAFYIIKYSYLLNKNFGIFIEIILCYFIIAPKALKLESLKVYEALKNKDICKARNNLSYIVGRDTENLDEEQIIKATVETVAENLSDGVIAPLIFVFIGGVPLGVLYKTINTLDSIMGYRNETFEYLGKFPARLDDIANFLPSRISSILLILATVFTTKNTMKSLKIFVRDRNNHKSPNSAQTESVCAGALDIQLGGNSYYKGVLVCKPTIGDDNNTPTISHIILVNKLMYTATVLSIVFMFFIKLL